MNKSIFENPVAAKILAERRAEERGAQLEAQAVIASNPALVTPVGHAHSEDTWTGKVNTHGNNANVDHPFVAGTFVKSCCLVCGSRHTAK